AARAAPGWGTGASANGLRPEAITGGACKVRACAHAGSRLACRLLKERSGPRWPEVGLRPGVVGPADSLDPDRNMIAFACHHCGASLRVDESMAGRVGSCPARSRVVRAPAPSDSSQPRPAPP